jgi:hypothetical protein
VFLQPTGLATAGQNEVETNPIAQAGRAARRVVPMFGWNSQPGVWAKPLPAQGFYVGVIQRRITIQ